MFKFLKTQKGNERSSQKIERLPNHVAVIMDGNGRWANSRGLSRVAGHKQGVDSVKALLRVCLKHEIKYLTIFAFSSENWNRPEKEVAVLMDLFRDALKTQTLKLNENGIRLKLLGDLTKFSSEIQELAQQVEEQTSVNDKLLFNVAVNYGGRWDIANACKEIAQKVESGQLASESIDESLITRCLSTRDIPDPDLFIRTSGEYRISNFLLWQAAYSEFYFTDKLWPDFDDQAFEDALIEYGQRDRRFGGALDAMPSGDQGESPLYEKTP